MASDGLNLDELGFADSGLSPMSEMFARFENNIATGQKGNLSSAEDAFTTLIQGSERTIRAAKKIDSTVGSYMDSRILAMYQLVEYWLLMEGDLWQSIIVPMAIALTKVEVRCEDEGEQKQFEQLFNAVDMEGFLQQMWAGVEAYGNIYPLQFWSDGDKSLDGLSLPHPKYIVVKPNYGMGERPLYLMPPDKATGAELLEKNDTTFMRPRGSEFNVRPHTAGPVSALELNPRNVEHIHHFKFGHELYAIPPLVRAQMAISTNRMLEEMIRATIEGLKNQIILWRLTDPRPREAAHLRTLLTENRRERMMHMVWDARLDTKQVLPGSVDALLANESWTRIKLDMFRKMGINVRILSGEVANVGQSTDYDIDVQLFLSRLKAPRQRVLFWLRNLCARWAKAQGMKEGKEREVVMQPIDMQVKYIIENLLKPLMGYGLPSVEDALRLAGFAPKSTLEAMRRESADGTRDLVRPFAGFAQDTVTRDDSGTETRRGTTESPLSEGRPEE